MKKEFGLGLLLLTAIRLVYGYIVFTKAGSLLFYKYFLEHSQLYVIEIIAWALVIYGLGTFIYEKVKKR